MLLPLCAGENGWSRGMKGVRGRDETARGRGKEEGERVKLEAAD